MSNFTPSVPFEVEFDGDTVTMQLKRLKKKDYLKMMPFLVKNVKRASINPQEKINDMSDEEMIVDIMGMMEDEEEAAEIAAGFMPEYVDNFQGLKDGNGSPVSFETVLEQQYFTQLVSEILKKLLEISTVKQEDADKLGKQQENSSMELTNQAMT